MQSNRTVNSSITEIEITPIKPINGLVGFASLVFNNSLYLGSIGIYTRPTGGFRLAYPTRPNPKGGINIFHPINKLIATEIEEKVIKKYEEIVSK